jgi:hypothetical protein
MIPLILGPIHKFKLALANGRRENKDCDKTLKELGVKNNDICILEYKKYKIKGGAPPIGNW